jgi:hypothetical protein
LAARGYTSAAAIALLLNATLTANQTARLSGGLIEAAEQYIDAYTGRSWLTGSPVVGERHPIQNARVWLKQRPITAVSAVRIGGQFETGSVLTVTSDYVVDAARGLITFRGLSRSEVAVDYTVPQTVPADISEAAGLIVAGWLSGTSGAVGSSAGIKSWSVDGERIEYRDSAVLGVIPVAAVNLLSRYARPVLA